MTGRDRIDLVLSVLCLFWWAAFIYGIFVQSPWVAAPAAFFILLDKLDEL